jgi:hypothetical protein
VARTLLITLGAPVAKAVADELVVEGLGPVVVLKTIQDGANRLLQTRVDHVVVLADGHLRSLRLLARAVSRASPPPTLTIVQPTDTEFDLSEIGPIDQIEADLDVPASVAAALVAHLSITAGTLPHNRVRLTSAPAGPRLATEPGEAPVLGSPTLPRARALSTVDLQTEVLGDSHDLEDTFIEPNGVFKSRSSSSAPSSPFDDDPLATDKATRPPSDALHAADKKG